MALRKIRMWEDEALRKKCREVEAVDDKVRMMLQDMADTMYHTGNGAGLAAPQVGILRRLVVIDMGSGLLQLVNPVLVSASGEQKCLEGCLSFPGIWGKVLRPHKVTVRALNQWGEEQVLEGEGEMAKCLCHELDHLDGIVFLDKTVEILPPENPRDAKRLKKHGERQAKRR